MKTLTVIFSIATVLFFNALNSYATRSLSEASNSTITSDSSSTSSGTSIELSREVNYVSVPILNMKTLPVISGSINGHKAYFIIDTGSTRTILDTNQKKKMGFKTISSKNMGRVSGIQGQKMIFNAYEVELKMGEVNIPISVRAMSLYKLVEYIQKNTSYEISGIIGSDTLKRFNIILDYGKEECRIGVSE